MRIIVSASLLAVFAAANAVFVGLPSTVRAQAPAKVKVSERAKAKVPPKVGQIALPFELRDLQNTRIKLSALTRQGPVVLVMLRGFPGYQCPLCTAQVGDLLNNADKFKAAKARVLLVYPGPARGLKERAGEFVRGKDFPSHFFLTLDPSYRFTDLYGLRWRARNETAYPSTFVLSSTRKVLYAKVSRSHGDRAPVEEILAALPRPE